VLSGAFQLDFDVENAAIGPGKEEIEVWVALDPKSGAVALAVSEAAGF
jgi:hypothetical protein